ncbi:unnamed protein product, partial [Prorocentrum cordatum]
VEWLPAERATGGPGGRPRLPPLRGRSRSQRFPLHRGAPRPRDRIGRAGGVFEEDRGPCGCGGHQGRRREGPRDWRVHQARLVQRCQEAGGGGGAPAAGLAEPEV